LFEEGTYELVSILFRAELLQLSHNPRERRLNIRNGALGEIRPLSLKALLVFEELFSVELCAWVLNAGRPRIGHKAWHANPRVWDCGAARVERFEQV
jgi:hypothetical protein